MTSKAEKEKLKFSKIAVSICLGYLMLYGILAVLSQWIFGASLAEEFVIVADTIGKELGLTALLTLIGSGAVNAKTAIKEKATSLLTKGKSEKENVG